jgi:hypothetical protein
MTANDHRDTHSIDWLRREPQDNWRDYALLVALAIALWLMVYRWFGIF